MPDRLTVAEREAFLSDVRIGVLSVASDRPDRAPISSPVWYDYSPETGVHDQMNAKSRKGVALEAAQRFVLVVQSEAIPYRYVTVEGPLSEVRRPDPRRTCSRWPSDTSAKKAAPGLRESGGRKPVPPTPTSSTS